MKHLWKLIPDSLEEGEGGFPPYLGMVSCNGVGARPYFNRRPTEILIAS